LGRVNLINSHLLSDAEFVSLATGTESPGLVQRLQNVQQSKHIMLLHHIAEHAASTDHQAIAFRAGYRLLTSLQAANPEAGAWLLNLPHLAAWEHHCLMRLQDGEAAEFGHFACLVATAAIRIGMPFELDVPVLNGRVLLPGFGSIHVTGLAAWIRLRCDGDRVSAGNLFEENRGRLIPDDGSERPTPHWTGTPLVRAQASDIVWQVLLETADPFLDRYPAPVSIGLSPEELQRWRRCIHTAWEILVRHHRGVAEPLASGISTIVPIAPESDTDLVSATSQAVFGAIATSWPPDAVTMAETLVHEFQHVKLGGLMDMVPLVEEDDRKVYAPWREDPRPARGLLQGVYAHLGIARFWNTQQHASTGQNDVLRAQVLFARWRRAVSEAVRTLLTVDCLTPAGKRFAGMLQDQGYHLESEQIPAKAQQMADEVALDHRLTWQLRHKALESAEVERLVRAFRQGEPLPPQMTPRGEDAEDVRRLGSPVRSRFLHARYLSPARYHSLRACGMPPLTAADAFLLDGKPKEAAEAYRTMIMNSADPQPDAWIGLSLAMHQLPTTPIRTVFANQLPLMFDMYARLENGRDPLQLARWLA
jgi:HEXXH motif-containing protein